MYPISEVFGPTIQGEGPQAGERCFFVRFAGCDWDCVWCDTKYAVNPKYPGWHKEMMSASGVTNQLYILGARPGDWIILSGGNPAFFVDEPFCTHLREKCQFKLAMETQGSVMLQDNVYLDQLVLSPKPPSAGMGLRKNLTEQMVKKYSVAFPVAIKVVVFNEDDYKWAKTTMPWYQTYGWASQFLSAGTDLASGDNVDALRERYRWLCEKVAKDGWNDVKVMPQLHVIAWGQKRGV